MAYGKFTWDINFNLFIFYTITVAIIFISESIITPLFITEKGFKKNLPQIISILLFLSLISIILLINDNAQKIEFNSLYIIIPSGIAYLIIQYLDRINIYRLAKEKNNYINDLK